MSLGRYYIKKVEKVRYMPGSSPKGKLQILDWQKELPELHNVLDIGPGWGTYPKLMKKKGQVWSAVEVYEPYVNKFELNKYYEKVYINDMTIFTLKEDYDLIILGDVLEHVTLDDGIAVLEKVLKKTKFCIVSLPLDDETGVNLDNSHEYWNNPNEKHMARWSNKYFIKTIDSLDAEIIGLKKFREISVYLISHNNKINYLEERTTLFDRLKHKKVSFDSEFSSYRNLRIFIYYPISKMASYFPSKLKKIIKNLLVISKKNN